MKKIAILVLFAIVYTSCSKDEEDYTYSRNESTIYTESATTKFSEILMILKPYIIQGGERKYVLNDTIYNIVIKLNGKIWSETSSIAIDANIYNNTQANNLNVTEDTVKYPVLAKYKVSNEILTTAGEYSNLLGNFYAFLPGDYILQVPSLDIKQIDGTMKTINTNIMLPFSIVEGNKSSFIGEFDVLIK